MCQLYIFDLSCFLIYFRNRVHHHEARDDILQEIRIKCKELLVFVEAHKGGKLGIEDKLKAVSSDQKCKNQNWGHLKKKGRKTGRKRRKGRGGRKTGRGRGRGREEKEREG
jgi:hypothetical protein